MLFSCTRENDQVVPLNDLVFSVSWGDENAAPTKTMIDPEDNTKVLWMPNEYFKVFSGTMSGFFYSMNVEAAKSIDIRGGLVPNSGDTGEVSGTYWALYPYSADAVCNNDESVSFTVPSTQVGQSGTFATLTAPAIAKSNGLHFTFYNVCGGVRFSVTEPGLSEVKISSISSKPLSGRVTVEMDASGRPFIKSVDSEVPYVTVTAPEGGFVPGEYYYAMLLPGEQTEGLALSFTKPGKGVLFKTKGNITVQRSRFGMIDSVDEGLWDAPSADTYQAVDLGLDVLWSTKNLGARYPESYGFYYAWGETEPKDSYSWENYKWGNMYSLTKYCTEVQYGTVDNLTSLEMSDDAASFNLGAGWRIPSQNDWENLRRYCIKEVAVLSGIRGVLFTSTIEGYEGNSIFIPLAGYWQSYLSADGELVNSFAAGETHYHARDFLSSTSSTMCVFWVPDCSPWYGHDRSEGLPIRPVKEK